MTGRGAAVLGAGLGVLRMVGPAVREQVQPVLKHLEQAGVHPDDQGERQDRLRDTHASSIAAGAAFATDIDDPFRPP